MFSDFFTILRSKQIKNIHDSSKINQTLILINIYYILKIVGIGSMFLPAIVVPMRSALGLPTNQWTKTSARRKIE